MQLSFIIPIYNVKDYIIECLKSVFTQIHDSNVEVILVNDGSTDNSMELVYSLLSKQTNEVFEKIKIINKENGGLSSARNSGLKVACGKFIYFLDSDDYISSDFLEKILPTIEETLDIIEFNASFFYSRNNNFYFNDRRNIYEEGLHIIESERMRAKFYGWQDWAVWYRVYNRNIWNNRVFPEGFLYEDIMTTPFIYQNVNKVYSLDATLIYYRNNPNSIMNKKSRESLPSINKAIQDLSNANQTSYIKIVKNRFFIASVRVLLENIGIYKTYCWMLENFSRLDEIELKITESKKIILINQFPLMIIPYFKLKSKRFFR